MVTYSGGCIWLGGNGLLYLAVYPMLLKLPALEAQRFAALLPRYVGLIIGASFPLVVVLGIVLGTVFGPIRSVDALVSPYGVTWLAALVLVVGVGVWGDRSNRVFEAFWEGQKVKATAQSYLRTHAIVEMIGLGVILACIVLMHFGY